MKTRVRFAPSPTGFFHIGSARTALFNWLYARHTGGTFILRIEDTDETRNSKTFLDIIYSSMRWLGLNWDEGPEVGGSYGPYRQSERGDLYNKQVEILLAQDRAYKKDDAIYFRVSKTPMILEDAVKGRVERTEDKDFVIVRSDGNPVFHLVNVVDDILMEITHVIRGEDHLSNTSKHLELFKAFNAPIPKYGHIPLILKEQIPGAEKAKGKMSKRDNGALIEDYIKEGFKKEAVINYLCLLGWSPKNNKEIMTVDEVISLFDLPSINKSNARFDTKKMASFDRKYKKLNNQKL